MKLNNLPLNYPFTAIVGQEMLKKALLLCAINPAIGGLLIQGDKGTAKSTAARALAEVVPYIQNESNLWVMVPFINLPIGATEERIIGSLDLEAVLVEKIKKFQPGLLAAVHQGILYIDEVNLLPDHLVDILLDVAAMGENRIEREGLSFSHPSKFTLIGTMNPEEGQLRPQFLDRFGLMVTVAAPADVISRTEVVRRRIAFEADPAQFVQQWNTEQQLLKERLVTAKDLLPTVRLDDELLTLISELTTGHQVKSLRADIVIYKTAITIAAFAQRNEVTADDVIEAASLALGHRSKHQKDQVRYTNNSKPKEEEEKKNPGTEQEESKNKDKQPDTNTDKQLADTGADNQNNAGGKEDKPDKEPNDYPVQNDAEAQQPDEQGNDNGEVQIFQAGAAAVLPKMESITQEPVLNPRMGKRNAIADLKRGLHVRSEPTKNTSDIAIQATVVNALFRDPERFDITIDDLQQKKRNGKISNLILFVVDASGSMAARKRMEAVKGTVLNLLTEAYEKRDTVGVIAFRGIAAEVILHPTQSIELAEEAMVNLPTGGRTPLADALQTAGNLLQNFDVRKGYHPLLIILTDGKANVSLPGVAGDPWQQTIQLANALKARNIQSLVLNSESNYFNLDKAEELAAALDGQYLSLIDISEAHLTPIINELSNHSR